MSEMNSNTPKITILVTGGAGYIGSHTVVELYEAGYEVIIVDNYINADNKIILQLEKIVSRKILVYEGSLLNKDFLRSIFSAHSIIGIIHFAALKAVGESIDIPLNYYENNVGGSLSLLQVMKEFNVKKFVFSSSATVYGETRYLPIDEKHPVGTGITNPYGQSKFFVERILEDLYSSDKSWSITILRYFNPVGSHSSGLIGENPRGIPNNLMPYIAQVASGERKELLIFGSDYDTHDGTGVRDYLHIDDIAQGHVAAWKKMSESGGFKIYNLGSGKGYSVLEMMRSFEKASGKKIDHKFVERRAGDLPSVYADASLAKKELDWQADKSVDDMCSSMWKFMTTKAKIEADGGHK